MLEENEIISIIKNKGFVTTKEITKKNIPRIYLTKLVKEKKIYRVERGIYSDKEISIDFFYSIQNKSKKIIFSHFTSLQIQGFYKNIEKLKQISVPQGYNAKKFKNFKVFYKSTNNYKQGILEYSYNGQTIKVYDIERSVCDIIKDRSRFEEGSYNKFINFYFNKSNLNYKKLLEYSKALRISKIVHHYLSLFKA